MKQVTASFFLLVLLVLGASCGSPDPTPMDEATQTSSPTSTPTALIAPASTPTHFPSTATPTNTPTSTATSTPLVWPAPPISYSVYNQYGPEILKYELGLNGCGLVAVFSALDDLGFPIDNRESSHRALVDMALANGFTETYGIQPSKYTRVVRAFFASQELGDLGTVTATQASDGQAGLERIRKELLAGNVVIVDILVASEKARGGTYPVGENGPALAKERINYIFAHYVRVLGFENGGRTIVLAETLHPGHFGNPDQLRVSRRDFLAAWENPEWRAQYHPWYAEEVYYWMMVISQP